MAAPSLLPARSDARSRASRPRRSRPRAAPSRRRRSAARRRARRPRPECRSDDLPSSTTLVNRNARRCSLAQPAAKLPAHQWMQFGILVDRRVDANKQASRLEPRQMLLEIDGGPSSEGASTERFSAALSSMFRTCRAAQFQGTICDVQDQCLHPLIAMAEPSRPSRLEEHHASISGTRGSDPPDQAGDAHDDGM